MSSAGDPADYALDPDELARHRARVFDALSRHSDPVMRELGRQLASGLVEPHELVDTPPYAEVLRDRLRRLDELDDDESRACGPGPLASPHPDVGDGGVPAGRR